MERENRNISRLTYAFVSGRRSHLYVGTDDDHVCRFDCTCVQCARRLDWELRKRIFKHTSRTRRRIQTTNGKSVEFRPQTENRRIQTANGKSIISRPRTARDYQRTQVHAHVLNFCSSPSINRRLHRVGRVYTRRVTVLHDVVSVFESHVITMKLYVKFFKVKKPDRSYAYAS